MYGDATLRIFWRPASTAHKVRIVKTRAPAFRPAQLPRAALLWGGRLLHRKPAAAQTFCFIEGYRNRKVSRKAGQDPESTGVTGREQERDLLVHVCNLGMDLKTADRKKGWEVVKMRKNRISVQLVTTLALATLVLMGVAAFAAAPDAGVKGLWLQAPAFPKAGNDVKVLEFKNNPKTGEVTYRRMLDALVTFEIRRQPVTSSKVQRPKDVEVLIKKRVDNDPIGDEMLKANRKKTRIKTDAREFTEVLTYPCATAEYATGANEDSRMNSALFIFTDLYTFEVLVSIPLDSYDDYREKSRAWLASLKFVE